MASASWQRWLPSRPVEWQFHPAEAGVEAVRHKLLEILEDCEGLECERLRWRLHTAESAQDLWLLRGSVFQAISTQHCQAQAAERLEALASAFRAVLRGRC
jgi:hypothetical protein